MLAIIHYFFSTLPMVFLTWGICYIFILRRKGIRATRVRIAHHFLTVTVAMSLISAFARSEAGLTSMPGETTTGVLMLYTFILSGVSCLMLRSGQKSATKPQTPKALG